MANKDFIYGKVPPQAKELEEAVLGAILLELGAFTRVYEILKSFHFYFEANQRVFKACESLSRKNLPVDLLTVVNELTTTNELDIVGGAYYVSKLTNSVVSSANVEDHARIILQKFVSREIIRIGGNLVHDGYDNSNDPLNLLGQATDKLRSISNDLAATGNININKITVKIVSDITDKSYNARNDIKDPNVLYTGIKDWDRINGQLFPGGLYIVAGRPAMGKGVHMVQCICNMAPKYNVGVINGEMTNQQLITRVGCNILKIDNVLWKKNPTNITDEELKNVHDAMEAAQQLKLFLDDKTDIHQVINKIRVWVERDNVKVVFADVLSKFKPPESIAHRMTDVQKLNYVMDAFCNCAKDLNIPIILYCHLNRETYKRQNKEPNLSDLKGSGNIEDFAYQVSLLHRPEYYDIVEDEFGESTKGLMYQIVAKHREGDVGRIKQLFLPEYSQLVEWVNPFNNLNFRPIKDSPF